MDHPIKPRIAAAMMIWTIWVLNACMITPFDDF
jgi:hypothetical protein